MTNVYSPDTHSQKSVPYYLLKIKSLHRGLSKFVAKAAPVLRFTPARHRAARHLARRRQQHVLLVPHARRQEGRGKGFLCAPVCDVSSASNRGLGGGKARAARRHAPRHVASAAAGRGSCRLLLPPGTWHRLLRHLEAHLTAALVIVRCAFRARGSRLLHPPTLGLVLLHARPVGLPPCPRPLLLSFSLLTRRSRRN
jgi:hypothetical protein